MEATRPLLPRYRRPLSFGGVLDESVQVFRRHWQPLAALTAVFQVPMWLISVTTLRSYGWTALLPGQPGSPFDANLRPVAPSQAASGAGASPLGFLVSVVAFLGAPLWAAAVTLATNAYLRGDLLSVREAYGGALRRWPTLIGAVIVYLIGVGLLTLLAIPLLLLTVIALVGLVPLALLIIWAVNPRVRQRRGLKRFIVLSTPYGLPVYYAIKWSLYVPAIVLERAGPWASLQRSDALVYGHWFRVWGVAAVMGLLVSALQFIPGAVVGLLAFFLLGGIFGPGSTVQRIAPSIASLIGNVLFAALAPVALALLFVDLRNRQEGTDLGERVAQLEQLARVEQPGGQPAGVS